MSRMCTAGQQYSGLFHWRYYYANIWNTVYFSIYYKIIQWMSFISSSVSIFQQVQSMVARTAIDSSFNKTYESMQTAVQWWVRLQWGGAVYWGHCSTQTPAPPHLTTVIANIDNFKMCNFKCGKCWPIYDYNFQNKTLIISTSNKSKLP